MLAKSRKLLGLSTSPVQDEFEYVRRSPALGDKLVIQRSVDRFWNATNFAASAYLLIYTTRVALKGFSFKATS